MRTSLESFIKFNQLSADLLKATGPNGVMAELESYFDAAAQLVVSNQIHKAVTTRLKPAIRAILTDAWDRSGLNRESEKGDGKLYDAATNPLIEATPKGITIQMSKSWEKSVFKRAGAFLYGAVYGPRETHEVRDTVGGRLVAVRSSSILGDKSKRSIKRAVLGGKALSARAAASLAKGIDGRNVQRRGVSLGEVHVRAPRNFWKMLPDEIKELQTAYISFVIEEANKILARHKAMRRAA